MLAVGSVRARAPRGGAVLVKVMICLPALVAVAALNLDGGRMLDERRRAQAAADAAALAGGANLYENYWTNFGTDPAGAAQQAALQVAAANGYPASAVTVNVPPQSGTFAGQPGHVEVIIQTTLTASFGQALTGGAGLGVSARAVARGQPVQIGIILLRPTGAGAFQNTAVAFALINKPLIVDSSDPAAFQSSGLALVSLSRIEVTGGAVNTSLLSLSVPIQTGVRPTLDPLATLPIPDASAAPVQSATPMTVNTLLGVLQPGVYNGGLHITGLSTVVMTPGVYIMRGGGFQVDGLATVVGLGVMVYNTTSATYASGPVSVSGLGKVVLTAPLSGTYQGLNVFQDRSMTQPVSITGLGLTTITGVVYAAQAPVNLTGSAAVGLDIMGGAYVASSMNVNGIGAVTISLGLNPPRVPDVRVVE